MSLIGLERFQFLTTQDGSPSLRFIHDDGTLSEPMHNLMGAFSESIFIYGEALAKLKNLEIRSSVVSLGLGLGYNEILNAGYLCETGQENLARIDSFEIDRDLREYFEAWILGTNLPREFQTCYDAILHRTATHVSKDSSRVKTGLKEQLLSGRLLLKGALTPETTFDRKYSCYLFDAFSSKTSPELWNENFLKTFFQTTADEAAVFSTYACTGGIKRSLRDAGFEVTIRKGFSNKRDSTFAVKPNTNSI